MLGGYLVTGTTLGPTQWVVLPYCSSTVTYVASLATDDAS